MLPPKCSSTSNVSSTREVSETTVEVGSSANTWEFMSSPYFKNSSININVTDYPNVNEHKVIYIHIAQLVLEILYLPYSNKKACQSMLVLCH